MPEPERVPITTTLANRMRKARESRELSQAELARKVRVPRARIKRIECHELETIDAGEYTRLAAALGISKRRKKKAPKAPKTGARKMRIRAARAVLEENGLLDVTLGDLLKV